MLEDISISKPQENKELPSFYIDQYDFPDMEKMEIGGETYIIAKVKMESKEMNVINKGENEERHFLVSRLRLLGIDSIPDDFIGLLKKLKEDDFTKQKVSFLKQANR